MRPLRAVKHAAGDSVLALAVDGGGLCAAVGARLNVWGGDGGRRGEGPEADSAH